MGCAQVHKGLLFTWVQGDMSGYHIATVDRVYCIYGWFSSVRIHSAVRALLIQCVYGRNP